MILSDRDIKKAIKEGRIKIDPAPNFETQLDACTLDLHLGNDFRVFNHSKYPHIDTKGDISVDKIMKEIVIKEGETFIIHPNELILASTLENLELADDLLGRIEGRSSLGRLGIIIHSTASVFHPGWIGKVTMEIGNLGRMPIILHPGMRICAFTFEEVSSPAEIPYRLKKKNKYAGQQGPIASKLLEEK